VLFRFGGAGHRHNCPQSKAHDPWVVGNSRLQPQLALTAELGPLECRASRSSEPGGWTAPGIRPRLNEQTLSKTKKWRFIGTGRLLVGPRWFRQFHMAGRDIWTYLGRQSELGVQPTIAYNPGMISVRLVIVMAMSGAPKSKKHGRAFFSLA